MSGLNQDLPLKVQGCVEYICFYFRMPIIEVIFQRLVPNNCLVKYMFISVNAS